MAKSESCKKHLDSARSYVILLPVTALRTSYRATFAILLSLLMAYGSASVGVNSALRAAIQTLGTQTPIDGVSDRPGPIELGTNPKRDMRRAGIWNDRSIEALRAAQLQWGASPTEVGGVASISPAKRPPIDPNDVGGGTNYPWEAPYPIGGSGVISYANTNTGNVQTVEPLFGFSSIAGTGIAVTLYHNTQTSFLAFMSVGWSCNYDASVFFYASGDATVRWGDGTVIPYTYNEESGLYDAPIGIYDKLAWAGPNLYKITKPDQTVYTFSSISANVARLMTISDRHGNNVNVYYDGSNRLSYVISPDGRQVDFAYDANGKLSTVTDPAGRVWTLIYNGSNQISEIRFPPLNGHQYSHSFTYSGDHIATRTDANGKTWQYGYTGGVLGVPLKIASVTSPMSHTTSFTYTTNACTAHLPEDQTTVYNYSGGRITSVVDPAGYSLSLGYNGSNLVTSFTDMRGKISYFTYDGRGNVLTLKDPLNHIATFTYNTENDLLTAKDPLNNITQYAYNTSGDLLTVTDPLNHVVMTNTYDLQGRMLTSKDAFLNSYTFDYDSWGNLDTVTDPLNHTSTAVFDIKGNVTSASDALGNSEAYGYDNWDRPVSVTHPGPSTASVVMDPEGRVTDVIDELGRTTSIDYDDDNRPISVTDAKNQTQTCSYNNNGWLMQTTNARGFSRTFTRNIRGEVQLITIPSSGGMAYTYDANGNVSSHTNAGGVATYTYDNAGRRTGVTYPGGSSTTFGYDNADRLTSMVDSQGTSTLVYDANSNVTQEVTPQGTINYTYDNAGRPLTMQRVGAAANTYYYDNASRLDHLTNMLGQTTWFQYDNADRLTRMTYGNGTYSDYGYDARSRVNALNKFKSNGTQFRAEAYNYDAASQLLSKTISGTTTNYTYDNIGELLTEAYPSYSASYTYDANGNRLTKTLNGVTDMYAYDSGDKLTGVTSASGNKTFTYGTLGRMATMTTTAGTRTFNYNFDGNLTSLQYPNGTSDLFYYNGLGARVKRTDAIFATRTFLRDGLTPASDVVYDSYINYTPGISERAGTTDRYYNDDALGNVTDLTDAAQNVSPTKWDAFGNGTSIILHGWNEGSNYEHDGNSGLKLLGYRYYDPSIGRFLTPDPAGVGSNWYAYCGNNPVTFSDPMGLRAYNMHEVGDDKGMGSYNSRGFLEHAADYFGAHGGELTNGGTGFISQGINRMLGLGEFEFDHDSAYFRAGTAMGMAHSWALGKAGVGPGSFKFLKIAGGVSRGGIVAEESLAATRLAGLPFKEVRKYASKLGGQAHHIVERRFAEALGLKHGDMAAVALTAEEHAVFTKRWRDALAYGTKWEKSDVLRKVRGVYHDYPELLDIALRQLK